MADTSADARDKSGRFQPGMTGNPGGRPKLADEVKQAARAHTTKAIEVLASIMNSVKANPNARINAACALLDRGWGKPAQALTGPDGEGGVFVLSAVPISADEWTAKYESDA